jgi:membrane-bound lytic murein transglycosylase
MAISKQVEDSLKFAEKELREALAFAARSEEPYVTESISRLITNVNNIIKTDEMMDMLKDFTKKQPK